LIAYFLGNTCAKYYENPTILSRVTAKNVGMFFETQCILDVTHQDFDVCHCICLQPRACVYSVWPKMSNNAPKYGSCRKHYQDSFSHVTRMDLDQLWVLDTVTYMTLFIVCLRQQAKKCGLGLEIG